MGVYLTTTVTSSYRRPASGRTNRTDPGTVGVGEGQTQGGKDPFVKQIYLGCIIAFAKPQ